VKTLAQLEAAVSEEVGTDLAGLLPAGAVERWVNEGRTRIDFLDSKTGEITWAALDADVDLPSDLLHLSRVQPDTATGTIDDYERWGQKLVFVDSDGAGAGGTARVWYKAYYPTITDDDDSLLPEEGDRALVSYALYRFFRLLTANRSIYRRYATIAGQNAVQIEDLQDEATRHYDDFLAAQETLPAEEPAFFFGRG
jgi:hypothetical protein